MSEKKIVLAVTGASGIRYAVRLANVLRAQKADLSIIVSGNAKKVMKFEEKNALTELRKCGKVFSEHDFSAPFASGSAKFDAVVVCPCSMKTLSAIANGFSHNLITRAADVALKERRKLILVTRETPLSPVHLRNMLLASRAGAIILPACPGFYHNPQKISDLVDFVVGKILDSLGIENDLFKRWGS
jgi:4-hydroxy-3-polyprenylbenzoate decarboxylase